MSKFQLYTDGSLRKGKKGAYAFAIIQEGNLLEDFVESVEDTTNNRMELMGVIEGLKKFDSAKADVEVISDSAYVVNCFLQKWYVKWKKNNMRSASGQQVLNLDLWEELLEINDSFKIPITWTHIRGHRGIQWNEHCDTLCDSTYK